MIMKPEPPKKRPHRDVPASENTDRKKGQPAEPERTADEREEGLPLPHRNQPIPGEAEITNQDEQEKVTNAPEDDGPVAEK